MANRRMFALSVVDTDKFLEMPPSSQSLYFALGCRADDDGFCASPKRVAALCGSGADDIRLLISKGFIIPFDSGVCVIRDWHVNNHVRKDRYTPTLYAAEKAQLESSPQGYYSLVRDGVSSVRLPSGQPNDNQNATSGQPRIGKCSIYTRNKPVPRREKAFSVDSEAYKAASWLAEQLDSRKTSGKPESEETKQRWAADFDKCNRLDGHPWEEIETVLLFCQSDPFWKTNIRSGAKFRAQYDALHDRMEAAHDRTG